MKTHKENTPIFGFRPAGEIDFTETQKELAMTQYDVYNNDNFVLPRDVFEEIINKLIQNVGVELMRLAEGERKTPWSDNDEEAYHHCREHNQALDTMKKHITSVTGTDDALLEVLDIK